MEQLYGIAAMWVITWRTISPIIVILGIFGLLAVGAAIFPAWRQQLPPPWLFPSMFVVSLLSVVWAGVFWGSEQSLPPLASHWRSGSHSALSILGMVIALGLAIWFRRVRQSWLVFACAAFVVLFTLFAWFLGAMAISNDWL